MKRSIAICLIGIGLVYAQGVYAKEKKKASDDISQMQKFYFELGVKSAKAQYYKKGYEDALNDLKELFKQYRQKLEEYEAGKYLIENAKITYPRIFRVKEGEDYKVVIEKPQVEKKFDENDLFLIPMRNKERERIKKLAQEKFVSAFEMFPYASERLEKDSPLPMNSYAKKDSYVVPVSGKSEELKKFLDTYGYKYAESDNGYKIFFDTKKEKEDFCLKVTGNRNCEE